MKKKKYSTLKENIRMMKSQRNDIAKDKLIKKDEILELMRLLNTMKWLIVI